MVCGDAHVLRKSTIIAFILSRLSQMENGFVTKSGSKHSRFVKEPSFAIHADVSEVERKIP